MIGLVFRGFLYLSLGFLCLSLGFFCLSWGFVGLLCQYHSQVIGMTNYVSSLTLNSTHSLTRHVIASLLIQEVGSEVPDIDSSLHRGRFWAMSTASGSVRLWHIRSCWMVRSHVMRGRPVGLLQSPCGEANIILLASTLSSMHAVCPNRLSHIFYICIMVTGESGFTFCSSMHRYTF